MTYTTKQGDTFDSIAFEQLGSCRFVERLINANRPLVSTVIFNAGEVLTLPTTEEETRTAQLPPWRSS